MAYLELALLLWPEIHSQNFLNLAIIQLGSRKEQKVNKHKKGKGGPHLSLL